MFKSFAIKRTVTETIFFQRDAVGPARSVEKIEI